MSHLRIRNWPKYQHYTDPKKGVAWVKLYVKILDDLEFLSLPESQQATLLKTFCLAGRRGNVLPADPMQLGALIGAQTPVDLELLAPWIEDSDGTPFVHSRVDSRENSRVPSKDSYSSSSSLDLSLEEDPKIKKRGTLEKTLEYTEDFETFWKAYPKKTAKKSAFAEWKKASPDLGVCLAAIEAQKQSRKWREGYILDPERWIKRGCWDDVVEPEKGSNGHARIQSLNSTIDVRGLPDYRLQSYPVDEHARKLRADYPDEPWRVQAYKNADFEKAFEGIGYPEGFELPPRRPE